MLQWLIVDSIVCLGLFRTSKNVTRKWLIGWRKVWSIHCSTRNASYWFRLLKQRPRRNPKQTWNLIESSLRETSNLWHFYFGICMPGRIIEKAIHVAPFFVTVIDGWPLLIFARGQISRILLWLGRLDGRDKNSCFGSESARNNN